MFPIDQERLLNQDLMNKDWIGEVVDNNDPEFQFRCKVKVFGLFDDLPVEAIPWAFPANHGVFASSSGGYGCGSVPKIGSLVKIRFANGDKYSPEYYALQNINPALQNEIEGDYQGTHVIAYDEDAKFKILYQPNTGIKIFLKDSHITINSDSSITIEHKDSQSIIELVGSDCKIVTNATIEMTASNKVEVTSQECILNGTTKTQLGPMGNFSAVAAEPLWTFLKTLAAAVDAITPGSQGANSAAAALAEETSKSKNVKITVS